MSHEVYPIDGHPELFLDASLVDGSYFIRSRPEIDATFAHGWENFLQGPVTLRGAEGAMFRSHFEVFGSALVCTQCGARFEGLGRLKTESHSGALLHMRANGYRRCPEPQPADRGGGNGARAPTREAS